jgi:hypothetical protein
MFALRDEPIVGADKQPALAGEKLGLLSHACLVALSPTAAVDIDHDRRTAARSGLRLTGLVQIKLLGWMITIGDILLFLELGIVDLRGVGNFVRSITPSPLRSRRRKSSRRGSSSDVIFPSRFASARSKRPIMPGG